MVTACMVDVFWCSQQQDDVANIDEREEKYSKSNMVSNSHLTHYLTLYEYHFITSDTL